MTREQARNLAVGLPLGTPTGCQLGGFRKSDEFCSREAVTTIRNIRICAKHLKKLEEIAANADPQFAARHPVASGYLRTAV